jgi:hypothetical protein
MIQNRVLQSVHSRYVILGLVLIIISLTTPNDWIKLGSRTVSFKSDWDEIFVTGYKGTFNAIKLSVEKSDVHFDRVIVFYRNRTKEALQIRNNIPAGGETRSINLRGSDRVIRKVVFYYQTHADESKKAKVTLFGKR